VSGVARRSIAVGAVAGALALIALASPATAHVTLNPNTAAPGAYATFAVRVPNEEPTANTVKIELYLPTDHPIPSVSVEPTPGWKVDVTTGALPKPVATRDGTLTKAVTQITWTDGVIAPGQFQNFQLLLGPLPSGTPALHFKALQTYSNGDVVRWIDGADGAHPAPSITLADDPAAASSGDGGLPLALSIAALAVAVAGVGAGAVVLRRSRRQPQ
jgi:uncharacterized protein YcnI